MSLFGRPVIFLPGGNQWDSSRRRQTTRVPRRNARRRRYSYQLSRDPFEYLFDVDPFDDVYVEDYPGESLYDTRDLPAEYVIPEPRRVYVYRPKKDPDGQKLEETMRKTKQERQTRNVQDSRNVTEPSGVYKKSKNGDSVVMDLDQLVGRLFRSLYGIEGELENKPDMRTPEEAASQRIENQIKAAPGKTLHQTEPRQNSQRQEGKDNRTNSDSKPEGIAGNDNDSRNLAKQWRNYEGRTLRKNGEAIVLDADQLVRLLFGSLYGTDQLKSGLNTPKEAAIRRGEKGLQEGSNEEAPPTELTENSRNETERTPDSDSRRNELEKDTAENEDASEDTIATEQDIVTGQEDGRSVDQPQRKEAGDIEAAVIGGNNCGYPGSRDTSGIEQTQEETSQTCAPEDGCDEVPEVNCDRQEMSQLDHDDLDNGGSGKLNETDDGQKCCVDDDSLFGTRNMSLTKEKQETTVKEYDREDISHMSPDLDCCPEEMSPIECNDLESKLDDVEDDSDCGCPVGVELMAGHRNMSETDERREDTTECEPQGVCQNTTDLDSSPRETSQVDNHNLEQNRTKDGSKEGVDTEPSRDDEVNEPADSKDLEKNQTEVVEDPDKFQKIFDLSSFLPEEIRAKLLDDKLILDAVHEVVKEGLVEKHSVQRVITLPPGVDPDSLRCRLGDDGHMTISANFMEKRKSKFITIEKRTV